MSKAEFIKIGGDAHFWKWIRTKSIVSYGSYKTVAERTKLLTDLYKKIEKRNYYPSPPKEYVTLNKGKGVLRVIPAFQLEDLIIYYYCVRKLERYLAANHVPGTYGGFGLSGKLRRVEEGEFLQVQNGFEIIHIGESPYVFMESGGYSVISSLNPKAWQAEWGDFARKLYFNSSTFGDGVVAEMDISNFYDSIQLDNLEYKIRKDVSNRQSEVIYLLFHFLKFWNRHINFYRQQGAGIPQDLFGECSRILANFYLQSYDKKIYQYCQKKGARYFRYADDQIIFAKTKEDLEEIIAKASSFLMRDGLNFNQKKVNIMSFKELNKLYSFQNFLDLAETRGKTVSKETLEKQINFYFKNKKKLRKGGSSLLKRILNISGKMKRKPANFKEVKALVLTEDFLAKSPLGPHDFGKIYSLLNKREQKRMLRILDSIIEKCLYSNYLYTIKAFYKSEGISTRRIGVRVTYVKNFYSFARTA